MPPADRPDENKLRSRIEELTGGQVTSMEREVRHRPVWLVDVERDGQVLKIYVRGDRQSDVQPFPELKREVDILEVLAEHGVPVPAVHGMCDDPPAIVMEAVAGTRDTATAADDEERLSVARQYIEAMVASHRVPVEAFVAAGLDLPVGPEQIALAGLDAYLPLYRRHKAGPEPLLEFATRWLRANVPARRVPPCFVAFDAAQFLFDQGRLTALFDLEYALIGDPYADLASMVLREPSESMGADVSDLCHHYAELVGEPLDIPALRYHQVVFSTVAVMQFVGAMSAPAAGDPHDVYLSWHLYLRRCLILVLAECIGVDAGEVEAPSAPPSADASLHLMLEDLIRQIPTDGEAQKNRRRAASSVARYLTEVDRYGHELDRIACEEAEAILGVRCRTRQELDERLERFVLEAGPEHDEQLFRFLARDVERQRLAHRGPMGQSADHARLEPIRP